MQMVHSRTATSQSLILIRYLGGNIGYLVWLLIQEIWRVLTKRFYIRRILFGRILDARGITRQGIDEATKYLKYMQLNPAAKYWKIMKLLVLRWLTI